MSSEATVHSSLSIRKGNLYYRSEPAVFQTDVLGTKGPCPGAIEVSTDGTDVDLSELVTPGLCNITNLDDTNYVEYGIWEPGTSTFYPFGELQPGDSFTFRFSRNVQEEYAGTGTGTTGPTNAVRFKANAAPVNVVVAAFEA